MSRPVIVYIAMSLDGYIAKANDDISFLSLVECDGEDYGYNNFYAAVDTVIMGMRTYSKVLSMGHSFPTNDKEMFIITRSQKTSKGKINFYTGSPVDLVASIKEKPGKVIFIDGGSYVVNTLLEANLIDEFVISIVPVILGEGISLFKNSEKEHKLSLVESKSYSSGLVQLHYKFLN
jgi:dihydrofolate reductase